MSAVDIIDGRGYILNVEFGGGKDGVDGKDGRDGVAPDLQIGTVKESEDDQPHVTISDEGDGKLSLNFDLVPGQNGQNGEDGGVFIPSVSQEGVISWIAPEGQNPPQAVSVKGETGATFTPTVSIGGEISWTNDKGLENPDEQNIRGPKGEKGDPFTIYKVYNSKAEMDADYSNPDVPMGAFVCITNSIDQSENATLYVKGTQEYTFVTDLSGATGMQGVPGVSIGRIGLMEEQHSSLYKEYGVWSDQTPEVLLGTFNLPVGEDGQQGSDGVGIRSIVQTTTSPDDGGTNVVTVTLEDDRTSTFNIKNGSKGSTGAQGPAGQDGQDGQDGVGIDHISVEQSTFDGQPNVVTIHLTNETSETFNVYNGNTGATGTAGTLNTTSSTAVSPGPGSESMSNDIRLHKISKTGNYNDLLNKPTIPAAANDSRITIQRNGVDVNYFTLNQGSPGTVNILVPTTVAELSDEPNYVKVSDLATVATSGSYYDLDDIPTIGNADLTIRSVDNATPETYTTIGTFHANAASPEFITLSKVARTGEYGDLKNIQQSDWGQEIPTANDFIKNKPNIQNVYSNFNEKETITNTEERLFTILMKRKILFRYVDPYTPNDINPCPLLRFGDSGGDTIPCDYIPLPKNSSLTMEISVSSISVECGFDGDTPRNIEPSDELKSKNAIFYLYANTDENGFLANGSDGVSLYKTIGSDGTTTYDSPALYTTDVYDHYAGPVKLPIFDVGAESGYSYTEYMKNIYSSIGKDSRFTDSSIGIVLFVPYSEYVAGTNGYAVGIATHNFVGGLAYGIDAVAAIRVLRSTSTDYSYEPTGWEVDTYRYDSDEYPHHDMVWFTGDGSSEHPYVPSYEKNVYYTKALVFDDFNLITSDAAPANWGTQGVFYKLKE